MNKNTKISKENVELLRVLYNQHKDMMMAEAKRILKDHSLAEDAVHQAFMKVIDKIIKFKDKNDFNFTAGFLLIVVRNISIDMYNSRKKSGACFEYIENIYSETEMFSISENPCDEIIKKESKSRFVKAIDELPVKYRDVLLLEKLYKYSQKDVAALLNISLDAVKKRSERAQKRLREEIGKEELV